MGITNKLNHAFKQMDLYIQPSPSLPKRILTLLDKKIMRILYGYDTKDYYSLEFYRLKLHYRKEFIGENNGLNKIAKTLNNADDIVKFRNKAVFNKIFAKYLHRDWLFIPESTFDEFHAFCRSHSEYIKKPVDQNMGKGIEKLSVSRGSNLSEIYRELKHENCLIEEFVIQDEAIAAFNPSSVNTCRVYSILNKSGVIITGAFLRMGVGDTAVDNLSAGGLAAKIDVDTGIITTPGKNELGHTYILHPHTRKQIIGFNIPRWEEIKKTVEEAAWIIPTVKYVGWDIAVNQRENICFIEANHYGAFNMQEAIDLRGKKADYRRWLPDIKI